MRLTDRVADFLVGSFYRCKVIFQIVMYLVSSVVVVEWQR